MSRLPNPWRPSSRKYKKNVRFGPTFKDGDNCRSVVNVKLLLFIMFILVFLIHAQKIVFNGLKKTSTSFYVDVMKKKLTTFFSCFTEFNEHQKLRNRVADNVKYFTSVNATTWDVDEGEKEKEKRTNRINCGWDYVSGTSSWRRLERVVRWYRELFSAWQVIQHAERERVMTL